MPQLWLKFIDPESEEKRVAVEGERFTVGRHSENDLTIVDSRLSRQHMFIERIDGKFLVSDCGSSNGTSLNGEDLLNTAELKDGDALDLGGVEIAVELDLADSAESGNSAEAAVPENPEPPPAAAHTAMPPSSALPAAESSSIPFSVFLIAPLLGIIILIFAGGLIYLLSGKKTNDSAKTDDEFIYSVDKEDEGDQPKNNRNNDSPPVNKTPTPVSGNNSSNTGNDIAQSPTPQNLSENAKIEQNGAAFMRRIAQNDPKAFLTSDQAQKVSAKIKQFRGSAAVAENINSARRNATQIRSLAAAKDLKPQFLAVAAISRLANSRGDVVQMATTMAEVLDKLGTQIGNELAEDSLLMIAAYDQGAAGDTMKMRNMLQDLSNKYPESSRAIRTIWFLHQQSKITSAEFESALSFLAIGTITQNPKEFGVNAEPLAL